MRVAQATAVAGDLSAESRAQGLGSLCTRLRRWATVLHGERPSCVQGVGLAVLAGVEQADRSGKLCRHVDDLLAVLPPAAAEPSGRLAARLRPHPGRPPDGGRVRSGRRGGLRVPGDRRIGRHRGHQLWWAASGRGGRGAAPSDAATGAPQLRSLILALSRRRAPGGRRPMAFGAHSQRLAWPAVRALTASDRGAPGPGWTLHLPALGNLDVTR